MNPWPLGEGGLCPSLALGNRCHPVVSHTHCSHLGPAVWEVEGKKDSAPWSALVTLKVVGSPWKAQP